MHRLPVIVAIAAGVIPHAALHYCRIQCITLAKAALRPGPRLYLPWGWRKHITGRKVPTLKHEFATDLRYLRVGLCGPPSEPGGDAGITVPVAVEALSNNRGTRA